MIISARLNILLLSLFILFCSGSRYTGKIMTVNGLIDATNIGTTLAHEHVLVDFIGADKTDPSRWDKLTVVNKVAPYFQEAAQAGVKTIVECTPAFLGRDPKLLKMLSDRTKMKIITNTGYYGAGGNKFLPPWAFTETAEQLAARWIDDFDYGIDGSAVRPGFIKISIDAGEKGLSDLHKKLVRAAALTHLKTGLVIYSHTGAGRAAFEQIEIVQEMKVAPSAFVWVHAQAEKDRSMYIRAAKMGAWVSLDGVGGNIQEYVDALVEMKSAELLDRVLISHDAGYYRPEETDGGEFRGYTAIFKDLIPALQQKGFTKKDIKQLLVYNPCEALRLKVRKNKN